MSFGDRTAKRTVRHHHGILSIRLKIVTVQEMSTAPIRRIAITASTSQSGSIDSCISERLEKGGRGHGRKLMRADFILINPPLLTVHIISNLILQRIALDRQQTNNRKRALASAVYTTTREKVYFLSCAKFMLKHSPNSPELRLW